MSTLIDDEGGFREDVLQRLESLERDVNNNQLYSTLNVDSAKLGVEALNSIIPSNAINFHDPKNHVLTKLNTPAGEIDVQNTNIIVSHATDDPLQLYWLDNAAKDGQFAFLHPEDGKSLEILTGGNFAKAITVNDGEFTIVLQSAENSDKWLTLGVGGGGVSVPSGTTANDHLQWNGTIWIAQQTLNFNNNTIGLAWRNAANTADIELKVDTTDTLDLTDAGNGPVTFQMRAQDAVETDKTFSIAQTNGTVANSQVTFDTQGAKMIFGAGGANRLTLDVSTMTSLTLGSPSGITATADFNIISRHATDPDNVFGFTIGSGTSGEALIDSTRPILNIGAGGATRLILDTSTNTDFTHQTTDGQVNHIFIRNQTTPADDVLIGDMSWLSDTDTTSNVTYSRIRNITRDVTNASSDGELAIAVRQANVLTNFLVLDALNAGVNIEGGQTLNIFDSTNAETISMGSLLAHKFINAPDILQLQIAGTSQFTITSTTLDIEGNELITDADGDTSIGSFSVDDVFDIKTGGTIRYEFTNDKFSIFAGNYLELFERGSDPTAPTGLNKGYLYVKDVGGQSHPFWIGDGAAAKDLYVGGSGVSFPIEPTITDNSDTWSGTQTLDLDVGDGHVYKWIMDQDLTFAAAVSNKPASGTQRTFELEFEHDGVGGAFDVTLPSNFVTETGKTLSSFTVGFDKTVLLTARINNGTDFVVVQKNIRGVSTSGLSNIVEDLTPQLGGILDTNSFDIDLNGTSTLILDADGDTSISALVDDNLQITVGGSARATFNNTDLLMAQPINMGGFDINNGGVIFLTEQAAAEADIAGKGQIWVKNTTPNELWFTDDAGTDFQLAQAGSGFATTELDNLGTTAINTDLLPDLTATRNVGSAALAYAAVFATNIRFNASTAFITHDGTGMRFETSATNFNWEISNLDQLTVSSSDVDIHGNTLSGLTTLNFDDGNTLFTTPSEIGITLPTATDNFTINMGATSADAYDFRDSQLLRTFDGASIQDTLERSDSTGSSLNPLYSFTISANNSTGASSDVYLGLTVNQLVATVNAESSLVRWSMMSDGVAVNIIDIQGGTSANFNGIEMAFRNQTPVAAPTYTITNAVTDRTFDANSGSVLELADVVATLIQDLEDLGLVVRV